MRRILALVCAGFLLLAVTACGDDGTDPLALLRSAGAATKDEGTAKLAMSVRAPASEGAELVTIEGEGVIDMTDGRGLLTMQLPVDLVGAGGPSEIETAFDGTTMFMKIEGVGAELGVDTGWVSFDLARLAEDAGGLDLTQLQGSGDPSRGLAMLQGASDDIEDLGREEVRGTSATHYRATIDLEAAAEQADGVTDPEQFRQFLDMLGTDQVPVDVWIDDAGRVRKQVYEQPVPGAGRAMTITVELFDFGTSEPIDMPAPEDVTDVTDQMIDAATAPA